MRFLLCLAITLPLLSVHRRAHAQPALEPPQEAPSAKGPVVEVLFDGRSLKHWSVIKKIDFEHHGKVAVRQGSIELGMGRPATGLVYRGKPPRINYEISLEARKTAGDDFFVGLTFPYAKQYCTLILGGWGGRTTGLSNVNDEPAIENETASFMEFKQNQWYRVRLRVTEPKIEAWVDDEKIVDLKTEDRKFTIWWEQEPARPLGIASWYTSASWRKIQLKRLAPAK